MLAIISAVKRCPIGADIIIHTDSKYAIFSFIQRKKITEMVIGNAAGVGSLFLKAVLMGMIMYSIQQSGIIMLSAMKRKKTVIKLW